MPDAEFSIYRKRSDFIRQHILPGGMLPSPAIPRHQGANAGLELRASFTFGQDHARTCRIWAARMTGAAPRIRRFGYDEPYLRGWHYYPESCAATFATGRSDVVQVEYGHVGQMAQAA